MRLTYLANSRIPTEKAHGFQIMKMCEAFTNAGTDVELWLPRRFNPIKESPFDYYGVEDSFVIKKIPVLDLIPLSRFLGPLANFIESVSFSLFTLFKLSKTISGVIYSRDQLVLWFLSFLRTGFVYEIHVFPKKPTFHQRMWHKASKIIAITQALKDLLVKQGVSADKILVAPDGVDLTAFNAVSDSQEELRMELGLPTIEFLIGYIGRFKTLEMEKGIKTMIEALPLLDKEVKMVFVGGEESEIKEYKNLANRFNVSAKCVFVGYQPRTKAIKYIKSMDALIIPFPNEPHYAFYASPLKLFEYMASGRPIIASDLPALKEILNEKNALFFNPEDAGDLARAIKMLKSSQMLGYHLSQQALADVKKYTWQKRAENIISFIVV